MSHPDDVCCHSENLPVTKPFESIHPFVQHFERPALFFLATFRVIVRFTQRFNSSKAMTFPNFQYSRIFEALFLRSEFETVCSPIPLIAHVQNFVLRRGGLSNLAGAPTTDQSNRGKPHPHIANHGYSYTTYSAQLQTESKQRNLRARETCPTKSIGSQQFHVPHLGHDRQLGPLITCILTVGMIPGKQIQNNIAGCTQLGWRLALCFVFTGFTPKPTSAKQTARASTNIVTLVSVFTKRGKS